MHKYKFIKLFKIRGVPINMHWSLSVVLLIVVLGSLTEPSAIVGAASFWAIMLLHELGHMYIAHNKGLGVYSVDLYLFHGACYYEESYDNYQNYLVAWGGVLAQAIIFIPAIALHTMFSEYFPWYINTPLIFLGYFSAAIAIINLAPAKGLDGFSCWRSIPIFFKRHKPKRGKKERSHLRSIK